MKYKGILSFPVLTQLQRDNKRKLDKDMGIGYSGNLLFPPGDPQIAKIQKEVEEQIANKFPNGAPKNLTRCFNKYSDKMDPTKAYYKPELAEYYMLAFTDPSGKYSPEQHLVGVDRLPIIDNAVVFPGAVAWVVANIRAYSNPKKQGIGCYINAAMITNEEPPIGRLDGAPTVEQMFEDIDEEPTFM
mgnify:FL=1